MKTIFRLTAILALLAGVCLAQGAQPGLTVQVQSAGTPVNTFKKLLILNCVSNLNCAYSGGILGITPTFDLSALASTTAFKPPATAGAAPITAGVEAFDTTMNVPVSGNGTSTDYLVGINPRHIAVVMQDEFTSGSTATTTIGDKRWSSNGITGPSYSTTQVAGHPGVFSFNTSAVINTVNEMFSSSASVLGQSGVVNANSWRLDLVVRINSGATNPTTQTTVRLGLFGSAATGNPPTDGIYFENISGASASTWNGITRAASTSTTITGATNLDNNWHTFSIVSVSGTNITFLLDGTAIGAASATNIPSAAENIVIQITDTEAVAKNIDVDAVTMWMAVSR